VVGFDRYTLASRRTARAALAPRSLLTRQRAHGGARTARGRGARACAPRRPCWFALVWFASIAVACAYVARYGSEVPIQDDLEMVGPVVDAEPVDWTYLWSAHNGHRVALPRLLYLAVVRYAECDLRTVLYLQVALLAGVALVLISSARRLRAGRTSWTDAFFPLLWVGLGNSEILLMPFGLTFTLPTVCAALWCACALRRVDLPQRPALLGMAACLLALPLCGGPGIAQVPLLALWMFGAAAVAWRSARAGARADAGIGVGAALLALALTALYFVGLNDPEAPARPAPPLDVLRTAAQFASVGLGPVAQLWWPIEGVLAVAACAAGFGALCWRMRVRPAERARTSALLAALAAGGCLALAIGLARWDAGPYAGLAQRYAPLGAPLASCVYLAALLWWPSPLARAGQALLTGALAAALAPNVELARAHGWQQHADVRRLRDDVRAGLSTEALAARHAPAVYPDARRLGEQLRLLAWAGRPPCEPPVGAAPWFMLSAAPIEVSSSRSAPRARRLDRPGGDGAEWVLVVPPEGLVRYALSARYTRVSGRLGLLSRPGGAAPRPVRFRVELRASGRPPVVLLERVLDLGAGPADWGWQPFDLELPPHGEAELLLLTQAPPAGGDSAQAPWWGALELR